MGPFGWHDGSDDDGGHSGEDDEGEGQEERGSQLPASKALVVFLVDCQPDMHIKYRFKDGDGEGGEETTMTYLQRTCHQILKVCREKMKKGSVDHVGLVFFNCKETNNRENHDSCNIALPLKELDAEALNELRQIAEGRKVFQAHDSLVDVKDNAHLHLALWTASTMCRDSSERNAKRGTYIFTCSNDIVSGISGPRAESRKRDAEAKCLQKVKDCVEQGMLIDLWPLSDADSRADDDDDDDDDGGPSKFFPSDFFRQLLQESIDEDGIMAETKEEEIEDRLCNRTIMDLGAEINAGLMFRSQASLEWTIVPAITAHGGQGGSDQKPLKIAVKLFSLAMEARPLQMVKRHKADNKQIKKIVEHVCKETGRVLDAQNDIESYFEFGGSQIPLSKSEIVKIKSMDCPQGILTLGFAAKHLVVKPGQNLRPCWLMRPDDKRAHNSSTTFKAFLSVLLEKDEVAICSVRKRSNEAPRLHALVPQRSESSKSRCVRVSDGFHVVPLPYSDDLRVLPPNFQFGMAEAERPDEDAIKKAEALIKKVGLPEFFHELEDGLLPNPSLLQQFAVIEAHALSKIVDEKDPVTNLVEAKKNLEPNEKFGKDPDIKERAEALKASISSDYDSAIEFTCGGVGKRKHEDPEAAANKKVKKEENERLVADMNWLEILDSGKWSKVTVKQLQAYCSVHDLKTNPKAKKEDYAQEVEKHLRGR